MTIAGPTKQIYGAQVSGTVFTAIADKVYSTELHYHENYNLTHPLVASTPDVKFGSARETEVALDYLGVNHQNSSRGSEWLAYNSASNIQLVPQEVKKDVVPNVKGMPLNDAVYLLENMGLRVFVSGNGKVVSQSKSPGTTLEKGSKIELVLK